MSINPMPSCNTTSAAQCAGFNQECFIVDTGGGADPADYLQFPIGQGVETLPGLISLGDIDVGEDIVMTGTPGVNYIEFPDGTKQYTAYLGSALTGNVFTIDSNTLANPAVYLMNPITITYPAGTKSFTAYAFSGGGNYTTPVQFTPNPAVTGQNLTYQPSVTSSSGCGAQTAYLPVKSGTSNCAQIVFQPNLTPTSNDPNSGAIWAGTVSLNFSTLTATLVSTGSSNPANLIEGGQIVFSTTTSSRYGCPSAIVLVNNVGGNNSIWNFVIGSTSSYYVTQTNITGVAYNSTPNRCKVIVSIANNILTVNSTLQGTLQVGYYLISTSFAVVIASQTNATTFVVKGCSTFFSVTSTTAYGFTMATGMDATLAVYSSNTTPTPAAFLSGSSTALQSSPFFTPTVTSLTAGLSLTQYAATQAITTTTYNGTYPVLPTITQNAIQNSGAVQNGALPNSSIITNCANSNKKITTFPAGGQPTVTQTLGGLGGFGVILSGA